MTSASLKFKPYFIDDEKTEMLQIAAGYQAAPGGARAGRSAGCSLEADWRMVRAGRGAAKIPVTSCPAEINAACEVVPLQSGQIGRAHV